MRKFSWLATLFLLFFIFNFNTKNVLAESVGIGENYKAIVKIKTFTLDEEGALMKYSYGSGVLLNNSGLVLTNEHVIGVSNKFDNSTRESGYVICLTYDINSGPDCSYTATLVASSKDLDVALLQMQIVSGLSVRPFSSVFLTPQAIDETKINDLVTAIGFPSIGGNTLTITSGIISGKVDYEGINFFKTDATISFGSSGGAVLDANGRFVGLSNMVSNDSSGSLGYVINSASINNWIESNKNNLPEDSAEINKKIKNYLIADKAINDSNIFENKIGQYFKIQKPADWLFSYLGENDVLVSGTSEESTGYVEIYVRNLPYKADLTNIVPFIKQVYLQGGKSPVLKNEKNIKINGLSGKKILVITSSGSSNLYVFPVGNNLIFISYNYGNGSADKDQVNSIINSFKAKVSNNNNVGVKKYKNVDPKFSFSVGSDWIIAKRNNPGAPINIFNKKYKDVLVLVSLTKSPGDFEEMDNGDLLDLYKETLNLSNQVSQITDIEFKVLSTDANYKISNLVKNGLKINLAIKTPSNGKIIGYKSNFSKKINSDYYLDIVLLATTPDLKIFNKYNKEFDKLVAGLAL